MDMQGNSKQIHTLVQVVEELMSIVDGQMVLQRDSASGQVTVDPQASVSRIGSRAYAPALSDLAVQLRFDLAQVNCILSAANSKGYRVFTALCFIFLCVA